MSCIKKLRSQRRFFCRTIHSSKLLQALRD